MTLKALIVLQDVKHAIERHNNKLQAESFRTSWVTIVTLLRAVGHVLANVDSEKSPELKRAIEEKWEELQNSKPEPTIFWGFIIKERNRFLKNYEHGIARTLSFPPLVDGTYLVVDVADSTGGAFSPGSEFESAITSGPYEGYYEKDVAVEAYNWWKCYINDVNRLAEQYKDIT